MKLLDPEVEAWVRDYIRKVQEANYQLAAAHSYVTEPVPNLDMVEHHLRLAQGKLAIARVDLAAARAAVARHGRTPLPPDSPETGEPTSPRPDDIDPHEDWA